LVGWSALDVEQGDVLLTRVGIVERRVVYEVVLSTVSQCGVPDAAPMGVFCDGDPEANGDEIETLTVQPYKSTRTYRNLVEMGTAVANLSDDPRLFYTTALKEDRAEGLPSTMFVGGGHVSAPRMVEANGFVELVVRTVAEGDVARARVTFRPVYSEAPRVGLRPYCRGRFAAIEAIIHATRVKAFLDEGRPGEAAQLIDRITELQSLVDRASPGTSYSRVVEDIMTRIRRWERRGEDNCKSRGE
jgi:hypothetical protein